MKVQIYVIPECPYCVRAKNLLDQKRVNYQELNIAHNPTLLKEMLRRSHGRKTVPQIFVAENHVGGCDDLYALDEKGQLDILLQQVS